MFTATLTRYFLISKTIYMKTLLDTAIETKSAAINHNFVQDFAQSDFYRVEKAIKGYFTKRFHNVIDGHSKPAKRIKYTSFEQIDSAFGLAYTSTGDYAGLWICNGVYVMVTPTHHFIGFAINTDGDIIAIAEDEKENSIYIKL